MLDTLCPPRARFLADWDFAGLVSQKGIWGHFPGGRLIRPISARSTVAVRPATQDDAPPFCTVKAGTARGCCENLATNLRSPARRTPGALSLVTQLERKEEMRAYPSDLERVVRRTASMEDWPY